MCDVSHNWSTPTDLPSNGARSIVFMGGQPFCSLYSSQLKLGKMPRSVQINPRRRTEASLITACGTAHRHLPASRHVQTTQTARPHHTTVFPPTQTAVAMSQVLPGGQLRALCQWHHALGLQPYLAKPPRTAAYWRRSGEHLMPGAMPRRDPRRGAGGCVGGKRRAFAPVEKEWCEDA